MLNKYLDLLAYFGIGGAHPGGFALTKSILQDQGLQPYESVLDIGCGTGQTAAYLAQKFGCKVTALDNHPIMIAKAQERIKDSSFPIKVIKGDVKNLVFEDNSFDVIISESVITFTNITKTLDELTRVLKTNGRMIMIEMTAEKDLSEELRSKVSSLYGIREVLNEEEWILKLKQAGFTKIDIIDTPPELKQSEVNDINQSENLSLELYDLLDMHNNFVHQYQSVIGFRAFNCHISK
ncbi:class I SAM-dependent methyltransferase [Paenisporosarcina sp. TG20]|uniref:class I SAM-dependent methyltransferase n=1 Tax=Paenisporosarcina sp. TG20 TaxID=1211706 RepID=UPI0003175715|nr:class I SAM-dependent methyltransferase [Paenisporosarcina sp. TG20]